MSHPQAFHTSCRSGVSGQPGFQFNAASPGLDRALLSQLASHHAGYHVPRDMPLEPTADDLARFPVALKVAPVDGVGPVVSRTSYVGREFRGHDGRPDEGRFGNYFSHIVLGAGGDDPFDGLLGIELWEASHWTDRESPQPELPELERLQPGPLDADRVAGALAGARAGVQAAILDAALAALDGGPRLVVIEPDGARAAAWIGWISYALPAAQARRLTFTTFDGRPRYADDVHVCITTPACDTAFAAHELGHAVNVVDVDGPPPPGRPSLYARVALALAEQQPDALATAVRAVPARTHGAQRGAWLAIAGSLTELVEGDELPAVVDLVAELAATGQLARAAATAKELPADTAVDRAMLAQWAALHRAARALPADEDSRSLAATALARIVPFAGELPEEIASVPSGTPTQPGVGNLAPWLKALEAAVGTPASGLLIRDGLRLGLVGVNVAVDRRLARVLSEGLAHTPVQEALRTIGRRAEFDHLVAAVTEALADRATGDRQAREQLRNMGAHAVVRATLRRRAEDERSFERLAAWLGTEIEHGSAQRGWAAAELAPLARDDRDHAAIRELWGASGPTNAQGHVDLLTAYLHSGRPPLVDQRRALDALMAQSLDQAGAGDPLALTLARCDARVLEAPAYVAWWVAVTKPGAEARFEDWARQARRAIDFHELPDARWFELVPRICAEAIDQRDAHDYARGLANLREGDPDPIHDGLVDVLEARFRVGVDNPRLMAELFEYWRRIPRDGEALVDDVLGRATHALKRRELDEVQEVMPPWLAEEWRTWLDGLPRSGVARAFGRRGRRAKSGEPQA